MNGIDRRAMTAPLGVEVSARFGRPLYVEPHVRLVGGAIFPPVWVGRRSYANDAVLREHTRIGRYCSIGRRITIGAQRHPMNWLSTHPFQREGAFRKPGLDFQLRATTIGNDVWICENVIVAAGLTIGDGAVLAAGAVVTKDVAPYTIVGGVPARKIGQRFDDATVARLLRLRWWELDEEVLSPLQYDSIEKCLDVLEGLPDLDSHRSLSEFVPL